MDKAETVQIMMTLGAFYSGGKNDPQVQANAWHKILQKYDYKVAEKAVFNFAEHDTRDYATFPAVGKVVQAIKDEMKREEAPIKEIVRAVSYGWPYGTLSENAKALISEKEYESWLSVDAEKFAGNTKALADTLRGTQLKLQGEVEK